MSTHAHTGGDVILTTDADHELHHHIPCPTQTGDTTARQCPIHRTSMKLRRQGPSRPPGWWCPECQRLACRRYRERRGQRRIASLVKGACRAEADRAVQLADMLMRHFGGWERLLAAIPPPKAAELAIRLSAAENELRARSIEAQRKNQAAVASAVRDPATVAAAVEVVVNLEPVELRSVLERLYLRARTNRARKCAGDGDGI
jgi:hypothetical protein